MFLPFVTARFGSLLNQFLVSGKNFFSLSGEFLVERNVGITFTTKIHTLSVRLSLTWTVNRIGSLPTFLLDNIEHGLVNTLTVAKHGHHGVHALRHLPAATGACNTERYRGHGQVGLTGDETEVGMVTRGQGGAQRGLLAPHPLLIISVGGPLAAHTHGGAVGPSYHVDTLTARLCSSTFSSDNSTSN